MPLFSYIAFVLLSVASFNTIAKPYMPASDAQVLEKLPLKPNDPLARELATLRAELQRDRTNLDAALRLARRYYELVGEEGDPRYLGYAQAALAPWWNLVAPPTGVQLLRASIRQFRHDFGGALKDLTAIIEREKNNTEALTLRAIIHIVQARYAEARADCQALPEKGSLLAVGCEAMVDGLTGKARPAYQRLQSMAKTADNALPAHQLWIQIRLAELAQYLGDAQAAESHYKQALRFDIKDSFLLAAYADFLLDQNRYAEVVELLKDEVRSDVLLLRLAFAERALKLAAAAEHEKALGARFHAAQLRGETVHQQEEARFALQVKNDPAQALMLARENWKVQREPRDARIYLEAAIAAKDLEAGKPVLEWLSANGFEDRTLNRLGQQLRGMKK